MFNDRMSVVFKKNSYGVFWMKVSQWTGSEMKLSEAENK